MLVLYFRTSITVSSIRLSSLWRCGLVTYLLQTFPAPSGWLGGASSLRIAVTPAMILRTIGVRLSCRPRCRVDSRCVPLSSPRLRQPHRSVYSTFVDILRLFCACSPVRTSMPPHSQFGASKFVVCGNLLCSCTPGRRSVPLPPPSLCIFHVWCLFAPASILRTL